MPLELSLGGSTIPTRPEELLDLKADALLGFQLAAALEPFLQATLSTVPSAPVTTIKYTSPAFTLSPLDGKVSFGLQANASGTLDIVNSGDFGTYIDGLESPQAKSIPVPQGLSYMRLSLRFSLSANVSGKYSGGAYGVRTAVDTSDSYAITFCKAFPRATKVIDAIGQTFESFVLPFNAHTLEFMRDGDFLFYEFDGNLNFALGAYAGVDEVLYAGQGSADVFKTFGSPLATISASVKPEIKAAASLDFKVAYASRFEAVLQRVGEAGRLHLFKSDKRSASATLAAGLTISLNASIGLKERVSEHIETLKTSIVGLVGDETGKQALQAVLDAGTSKLNLQKYADEVTDKLASWLNRANGLKANLEVAIESTRSRTLLAGYTFQTVSGDFFTAAWTAAIEGDLAAALSTGIVTLDVGSGLELEYQKKTNFKCNFFNMWSMSAWSQFRQNVSLVYAGNNTFHFLVETGRTVQTTHVGAMRSIDLYFSARADAMADGLLSNTEITLNLAMSALGDRKGIERIAVMLSAFDQSQGMSTVVRDLRAFATNTRNARVHLVVKIPGTTFQQIVADTKSGPHDRTNWNNFARAADDLDAWPLRSISSIGGTWRSYFKSYDGWMDLDVGESGVGSPDRTSFGSLNSWRSDWPVTDSGSKVLVIHSMWAGQRYMNFCADLQALATMQGPDGVRPVWESFLELIGKAVEEDTSVDFLAPAALATMRQCKGPTFALMAPGTAAVPVDHFSVGIVL